MTESTTTHKAFSNLDAREPLYHIITSFFESTTNQRKFTTAYKEYTTKIQHDDFARTKKIFDVLEKTDITTKKEVMRCESKQGLFYLIERRLLQAIERERRKEKRNVTVTSIPNTSTTRNDPPSTENSYSMLEDSDDALKKKGTNSKDKEQHRTLPMYKTPIKNPYKKEQPKGTETETDQIDTADISPDLVHLAKTLEAEAKAQIDDIANTEKEEQINYQESLQSMIDIATADIKEKLEAKGKQLDMDIKKNNDLQTKVEAKIKALETLENTGKKYNDKLNNRLCYFNNKFNEIKMKVQNTIRLCEDKLVMMNNLMEDEFEELNNKVQKRIQDVDTKIHQLTKTATINDVSNGSTTQTEMKTTLQELCRLHRTTMDRLNTKSKIVIDSFIEHSTDALNSFKHKASKHHRQKSKKKKGKHTPRRLTYYTSESEDSISDAPTKYDYLSSSDDSGMNDAPYNTHTMEPTDTTNSNNCTSKRYQSTPNAEYLRKNVRIKCSEESQVLEFYIKLRIAIAKGGIYIIPVNKIKKEKPICQKINGFTKNDYTTQSNALYTLLSNESIVSADFTMAQNCILSNSITMDGFTTLKAMLKRTHPSLTNTRPPSATPTYDQFSNLHMYKQGMRNHFLLHELFNKNKYTPLEQAKEFIRGIHDESYSDAIQRIQGQLDTVENMGINLHVDYTLENIATTIINMSEADDKNKVIVRAMRNNPRYTRHRNDRRQPFNKDRKSQAPYNNKHNPNHVKFTKIQCHACKLFGHSVAQCRVLPKVLAIMEFAKKEPVQCQRILQQHINNNTLEAKKTFVRTLQQMNVLSDTEDSDHHLENAIILHTAVDNSIDMDAISDEE